MSCLAYFRVSWFVRFNNTNIITQLALDIITIHFSIPPLVCRTIIIDFYALNDFDLVIDADLLAEQFRNITQEEIDRILQAGFVISYEVWYNNSTIWLYPQSSSHLSLSIPTYTSRSQFLLPLFLLPLLSPLTRPLYLTSSSLFYPPLPSLSPHPISLPSVSLLPSPPLSLPTLFLFILP